MDNNNSNKNIDGGKAFAEGGYGCVFRPALKCKTEKNRRDGVSKLMVLDKAYLEYNEISKISKILSNIPNYRSLFMFPYNVCKISPLNNKIDLPGFNKKCNHLSNKANINSKTINKPSNLNRMRSITLPDGGKDVDMKCKDLTHIDDFLKLNNSLIQLLKYGIIPMNYYKVYHFDIKDTNVLVDKEFTTRLTDWGLSGIVESKDNIPSIIANRPLQSNLPFSNILFNPGTLTRIDDFYQSNKKNYTYKIVETFVKQEILLISKEIGSGHYDYLKPIYNNHIFEDSDYDFHEELVGYITQVLFNWKHSKYGFDLKKYFFKVFLPNADIWGFITIYFAFFTRSKKMNIVNEDFYKKLRNVITKHLLFDAHKPINLIELVKDIKSLNELLRGKEIILNSVSPRTPQTKFLKSTKTINFKALQTHKRKNVEKIMKRAEKNKTKKSSQSNKKAKNNTKKKNNRRRI
jgi:hypothetical protein